ncbi:YbaB/EbfC family nucleoid-associated protein [Streptomyces sp. NPDC059740]|uniref:YbaB/EbfC family nucleoid-associated protein n=1 Tax=Streptomyces sp. NPDC059740 TaxID=3346926 RepID=UPI00365F0717
MRYGSDDEMLRHLDTDVAELGARARRAAEAVAGCAVTRTAPDRSVTVTVGASGNLLDIAFGRNASALPPQRLAALVMKLVGEASARAGGEVRAAFGDLVGGNPAAMDVLSPFVDAAGGATPPGHVRPRTDRDAGSRRRPGGPA